MKLHLLIFYFLALTFVSCHKKGIIKANKNNIVISFGSCNNQNLPNTLWGEILKNKPELFIWGGDIIYADTYDMKWMKQNYTQQKYDSAYQAFTSKVKVIGTWDDHDYGLNDGGAEYKKKDSVQQLFLDFFDVDKSDKRRSRQGVYFSKTLGNEEHSINIIVLDTRYFRTELTKDSTGAKRYIPNTFGDGTLLGKKQWDWLEETLSNSKSRFNIIVSSIQVLSNEHGFETWGNMPHEVDKLKNIIVKSKAKGVIILSGDRHIGEISIDSIPNLPYPLIDITSSGLTHSYSSFSGENNPYRVGKVISSKNFGLLKFNFDDYSIRIELRGDNNELLESYLQTY